jgi:hypothetical protein
VVQTTRTWGFWKTHTWFTKYVFDNYLSSIIQIDSGTSHAKTIDSYAKLFGAFESNVARDSTGAKRSAIDSARISMLHQLLAAVLNNAAFGTTVPIDSVTSTDLITAANNAYSGEDISEINRLAGLLDTFNNAGDNIPFPDGLPHQGPATPKDSKDYADTPVIGREYWDDL